MFMFPSRHRQASLFQSPRSLQTSPWCPTCATAERYGSCSIVSCLTCCSTRSPGPGQLITQASRPQERDCRTNSLELSFQQGVGLLSGLCLSWVSCVLCVNLWSLAIGGGCNTFLKVNPHLILINLPGWSQIQFPTGCNFNKGCGLLHSIANLFTSNSLSWVTGSYCERLHLPSWYSATLCHFTVPLFDFCALTISHVLTPPSHLPPMISPRA